MSELTDWVWDHQLLVMVIVAALLAFITLIIKGLLQ